MTKEKYRPAILECDYKERLFSNDELHTLDLVEVGIGDDEKAYHEFEVQIANDDAILDSWAFDDFDDAYDFWIKKQEYFNKTYNEL